MTEKEKSKKRKNRRIKRTLLNMFILLCFSAAAFLLYQSVITKLDEKNTNETYAEIERIYNSAVLAAEEATPSSEPSPVPTIGPGTQDPSPSAASSPTSTPSPTPTPEPSTQAPSPVPTPAATLNESIPQRDVLDRTEIIPYFNSLLDVNEDIRGYIKIPATNISYPVVQGIDNDFYLERNIYGKKTISASIFMDYRNNAKDLDDNTIIYGHNLNTTMFNDLDYFVDEATRDEYLAAGGVFRFDTPYEVMSWEIYSAYVVDKDDFNYLIINFSSADRHQDFLDETMERSFVDTGITVTPDDKVLTLSTCNHWLNDSRTVIHARLIRN